MILVQFVSQWGIFLVHGIWIFPGSAGFIWVSSLWRNAFLGWVNLVAGYKFIYLVQPYKGCGIKERCLIKVVLFYKLFFETGLLKLIIRLFLGINSYFMANFNNNQKRKIKLSD